MKNEIVKRVITGFVVQTFLNGECIHQEFVGDDDTYEDEYGDTLDYADYSDTHNYPTEMWSPILKEEIIEKCASALSK